MVPAVITNDGNQTHIIVLFVKPFMVHKFNHERINVLVALAERKSPFPIHIKENMSKMLGQKQEETRPIRSFSDLSQIFSRYTVPNSISKPTGRDGKYLK